MATTEKIPEMLLSRAIQITMRKAPDPNPERRDPEPEDFEEIREKLYVSRLTYAPEVYKTSIELDKENLGLNGREYEVWKPILIIAKVIGEDVFNDVLDLAKKMIEERKEHLHEEEKLLLHVIGDLFKEKGVTTLEGDKHIEFSASEVLGGLKELLLSDEYGDDEKRFYKDWNPQKIGVRLTRMGIKKYRKGGGKRVYSITYDEYNRLLIRYNMSHLSHMSQEQEEASTSQEGTTKIEKKITNFVEEAKGEKKGEVVSDKCDMCDKFSEKIDTDIQQHQDPLLTKAIYVLQEMGGEAGIPVLANKLRVPEGKLRLLLQDHLEYFVVKGDFVYTKARWEALKTNGNGEEDILGERSL
ncbi:MAG TPA: DUF3631 domain-containing protein [Thermoproteales archaeon]|nr:DUF3631 domain-containing protein [Thermoproteales archaeon]